ncbi:M23 family metallopeptidase [Phocaeicola coprophilus]|nr:M23 family metallopeptidase [Phocaeicola coprophilus]
MKRKPFWQNIKFKYKLTIVNENTLEEVVGLHVSKLNGLSVLLMVFTVLFAIAALIVSFTPLRNYLPGYMNSEVRKQIVDNALLADSLSRLLERQNLYVMNLQDIIRGEVRLDSVRSIDSLTVQRSEELMERTENEERFRKEFEEQEKYNLANVKAPMPVSDIIFYRPALGMLSKGFDPEGRHFGVDIAADAKESVLATLDGTVIFCGYMPGNGYVILLQHATNLVSAYKHCGSLLKSPGDKVTAGEVIALVGDRSEGEEGHPHLHFELWHRGQVLNPEQYIVF